MHHLRILLLAWLVCCAVAGATAATYQRTAADESFFEQQVSAQAEAALAPFRAGTAAMDRESYAEAETQFRLALGFAPKSDVVLRRLSSVLGAQGRIDEARATILQALAIKRTAESLYVQATQLAFPKNGQATPQQRTHALSLLREARQIAPKVEDYLLVAMAQVALSSDNLAVFHPTAAELLRLAPNNPVSHYFSGLSAALREEWIEADNELVKARALGFDAKEIARVRDQGIFTRALAGRSLRVTLVTVCAWLIGLGLLGGLGVLLSRLTLRQIERSNPLIPVGPVEQRLRRFYRHVLTFAGVYYYLSLPIVMVLVVVIAAALIYACLVAGFLPINLVLILGIGAIATIWSMGRSLFLKVKQTDPGRALTREEAPGLWQLTDDVARTMDTRAIDEIRVTPGTDLCVYERGTWREKLNNRAHRILVIGTAVIPGFQQEHFRSVLAHEYGHFSNRDTAGGDVAFRVQNDMLKFYYAMVEQGQATWLNVAFHFLRAYHFLFRRISHGATRLQEVLADRVAALAYGPAAFEGGLRHVVRQSIQFSSHADEEIEAALKARRPVQNLYSGQVTAPAKWEKDYDTAINRPTTADDTHPGPVERFRLIAPIPTPANPPLNGLVWDLFQNPQQLIDEMMATVEKNLEPQRKADV